MTLSRRCAAAVAASVALCALVPLHAALAQDFPTRPIRIVIAFPAGGPTDIVGRMLADKVKGPLGQNVLIENKPGANGAIGADFVAKAEPDGHTLFLTTVGAVAVTPHMRTDLPYQPLRDFAPVVNVVRNTTVLVVNPNVKARTAKEFAALAKEKPDAIPFASTGVGSTPHLALELYQASAGIKFIHVPYRGAAPAVTDLLGGQVQALFADVPVLISHIGKGTLIPIGAAANERSEVLAQVPTLAEQGYPDTDSTNWYGLLAPAKTPPAVIAKLNAAFNAALKDPDVRKKLLELGATPVGGTPQEFGAYFKAEYEKWGKVVRERGIKG